MKFIIVLVVFFFVMFVYVLKAQVTDAGANILYDFKTKILKYPENEVQEGDFIILKIKNLNQNLYKIDIDKRDSTKVNNVVFPTFSSISLVPNSWREESWPLDVGCETIKSIIDAVQKSP